MAQYSISIWHNEGGPVVDYRKARSAVEAVDTLIECIKWVSTMNGTDAEKESALTVARGWVPSRHTPRVSVKIGKYEIDANKAI